MFNFRSANCCVAVSVFVWLSSGLNQLRSDETETTGNAVGLQNARAFVSSTRDIIEAVMQHHVDPPTRQQLVLEVIRSVATAESKRVSLELSQRISEISDVDELYELLTTETEKLTVSVVAAKVTMAEVIRRFNQVIPGGVQVVLQKEHNVNEQLAANRYVGIGVQVGLNKKMQRLELMRVFEGGTADGAGLSHGDVIMSVDGKDTQGIPIGEVVDWLRGPEGSSVKLSVQSRHALTIQSRHAPTIREIEMVRKVIPLKTAVLVESGTPNGAMIRLERITASTVHELRKLLEQLPDEVETVILDLRSSPEHSLHYVQLLANALVGEAKLGFVESRSGMRPLVCEAGTIFADRKPIFLHSSTRFGQIEWLASVLDRCGIAVYRDPSERAPTVANSVSGGNLVYESVAINSAGDVLKLATGRLLTNDRKLFDGSKPTGALTSLTAGEAIQSRSTLRTLWQSIAEPTPLSGPVGIVVQPKGATEDQQQVDRLSQLARVPQPNHLVIKQILAIEAEKAQ